MWVGIHRTPRRKCLSLLDPGFYKFFFGLIVNFFMFIFGFVVLLINVS